MYFRDLSQRQKKEFILAYNFDRLDKKRNFK